MRGYKLLANLCAFAALLLIIWGVFQYNDVEKNSEKIIMDAGSFNINVSNNIVGFHVSVKMINKYDTLYSFTEIPINVTVELDESKDNLDNITIWFYYADKKNLGYSYFSEESDDFSKISVKSGDVVSFNGKILFSKSGDYKFYINDNNIYHNDYELFDSKISKNVDELESSIKRIPVDDGFKIQQIRYNAAIKGLTLIALGASLMVIAVMLYQSYLNQNDRADYQKKTEKLISKLDKNNKVILESIKRENNRLIYRLDKIRSLIKDNKNKRK